MIKTTSKAYSRVIAYLFRDMKNIDKNVTREAQDRVI